MAEEVRTLENRQLLGKAERLLREGRSVVIPTAGRSMLPFIHGGRDTVRLEPAVEPDLWQIVLVHSDGRYFLHRIVALASDDVVLMGDGNLRAVERCRPAEILGVAQAVIRPDGREIPCLSRAALRKGRMWYHLRFLRRPMLWIYKILCHSKIN